MPNLENYTQEKLTIDLAKANVFSIILLIPILLIFGLPYYLLWGFDVDYSPMIENLTAKSFALKYVLMLVIMVGGIVLHELIHGFTWSFFAENGMKSMKFGVLWKMLTPYCHCTEPLQVRHYIIGGLMPALILGIIPSIIAITTGSLELILFGMFFTLSAAGDFLIVNLIRKEKPTDWVQDHPSEAGCYVFRENVA